MSSGNFIQNKYNATATDYAKREERLYWLENHSRTACNYLQKHNTDIVVDIGCGSGAVTRKLAKEFPSIKFIGIDFSSEMIRIAKETSNLNNTEWIELDISLKQNKILQICESYDHVLILAMGPIEYYYLNDLFSRELSGLFQSLKHGAFICTFLNRETCCRSLFNKEDSGKKYWRISEAKNYFSSGNDCFYVRCTSFILFDIINFAKVLDRIFLIGDKILSLLPVSVAKKISVSFEIILIRK